MNCEKCNHWNGSACTDTQDFVNRHTGEDMCKYNSDAIPRDEYDTNAVTDLSKWLTDQKTGKPLTDKEIRARLAENSFVRRETPK